MLERTERKGTGSYVTRLRDGSSRSRAGRACLTVPYRAPSIIPARSKCSIMMTTSLACRTAYRRGNNLHRRPASIGDPASLPPCPCCVNGSFSFFVPDRYNALAITRVAAAEIGDSLGLDRSILRYSAHAEEQHPIVYRPPCPPHPSGFPRP